MPTIGVSIEKQTSFRNSTQKFANVYYYDAPSIPSQSQAAAIIDNIKGLEQAFHSTAVTFVRGRLWSAGGTPSQNNMIDTHALSGVGSQGLIASFDRERAYLFRLRAGQDSRGRAVYLRKWYHACGTGPGGITPGSTILENTAAFSAGNKATMETAVDFIRVLSVNSVTYSLCSKSGRAFSSGETFKSHNFLEHHQLGDQWRSA